MKRESDTQSVILGAVAIVVAAATFYFDSWWPLIGAFLLVIAAIVIFAVGYQRSLKRDRDSGKHG